MRGLIFCLFLFSTSLFAQPGGPTSPPDPGGINHWETVIKAEEQWRYFLGTMSPPATEPASNWRTLAFDDNSWPQGAGGFGYGDNDDATTITPVMSVFMRKKFIIVDKTIIESAVLSVDYDDGFVAYLNGTEIARANMDGRGIFPPYTANSSGFGDEGLVNPLPFIVSNATLQSLLIQGENVLAVQVHNENEGSSDLTSNVYFSVGITDETFTYQTPPAWFTPPTEFSSDLPIILLNTNGQGIPDDPKLRANMSVIDNGPGNRNRLSDPFNNYNGFIDIETRGESSQMFPKKSYSLETVDAAGENLNVELLGFPAENDWILYAPYTDKSMMRNEITFKLARDMGRYASRTRACEVFLNGDYQGVYTLMEKIKVDDNRVDIASLNPDEVSGDDLTGGYILRVDKWDGNDFPAWSSFGVEFQYFDPKGEDLVTAQKNYIQNFIGTASAAIAGANFMSPTEGYRKYIDVNACVDFMLINELGKNVDGFRFSTYMYKDKDSKGGKLIMGPLWDFNLAYGNVDYNSAVQYPQEHWLYNDSRMFWYEKMVRDPYFKNKMKTRWDTLREDELSNTRIIHLIDSMAASLAESQVRNYQRWPILGTYVWPNQYVGSTYADEVAWFKNWIIARANWMDANLPGIIIGPDPPDPDPVTGTDDEFKREGLTVYPNPVKNEFTINWHNPSGEVCEVKIINPLGQEIFSAHETTSSISWKEVGRSIQRGMYIVSIKNLRGIRIATKLVKE